MFFPHAVLALMFSLVPLITETHTVCGKKNLIVEKGRVSSQRSWLVTSFVWPVDVRDEVLLIVLRWVVPVSKILNCGITTWLRRVVWVSERCQATNRDTHQFVSSSKEWRKQVGVLLCG